MADPTSNAQASASENGHLQPTASVRDSIGSTVIEEENSGAGTLPTTPGSISRAGSFSGSGDEGEYDETVPPLDRLTIFDLIENLALPQKLERLQSSLSLQTERVRRQQERLRSQGKNARIKVVEEWRRRVPTADEQLEKYKQRMRKSVDRLNARWSDSKTVTLREKVAFMAGVMNVFVSGYLVGGLPELYHYWYSVQLCFFMPYRWYTYHKKGYHYFLADLCYFVNVLVMLSIWVFPNSKRLFISAFCLAFGNNAIAIAMWRNSLVFHSMDKVVSLFIHIMPCVSLHCITHLISPELQAARYPAVYKIMHSDPASPDHYSLWQMMFWASCPYAVWQLSYHIFISVRRAEKIAAGRPTSFTWLRKSYQKTFVGKFVLGLPESLQETTFMLIQYFYAMLTMVPVPLWFWYRWLSAAFLMLVFTWSVWNGATFYIDVFGMRFSKELEQLKKDVAKWQSTPDLQGKQLITPLTSPTGETVQESEGKGGDKDAGDGDQPTLKSTLAELQSSSVGEERQEKDDDGHLTRNESVEKIPPLDATPSKTSSDDASVSGFSLQQNGQVASPRRSMLDV